MVLAVRNLGLIICCIYASQKIQNKNISKQDCIIYTIFSIITVLISIPIETNSTIIIFPTIIISISLLQFIYSKDNFSYAFICTSISYAISYISFFLSTIIICGIYTIFHISYEKYSIHILILFLQCFFVRIPFKFKRTKHGMPFLKNNRYYFSELIISICILISSIILNEGNYATIYFIFFCTVFILAAVFIIYWRNSITKTYLDELIRRNNLDLSNQLEQLTKKYEDLYADKERLSEIVHSDKKLVNSLKNAVLNYLENGNNDNEKGKELLNEIERYSKEREGNIKATEMFLNPLPSCNITAIDNLLAYMYQKSKQNNIELTLTINCDVSTVSNPLIDIEDFVTLLADLIDNAIIATKHNEGKLILVSFSMIKNRFTIQVSDSGIPFTKEVLFNMGRQQITTHADENGNGIGMMKTYKILHKTNASLFIDEKNTAQAPYTKTISVVFNKKHQTILSTNRDETEIAYLYQRPDIIIR
ncbi:MAG: GHKL domain-containing protein [Lachnospiraceae bacterium]